ncbi:MAG: efflux RND transporter permease subunit, partial [Gammaproteobacteria bacterium]|nr:efflux RND transporter permease subunit [Gammaproteobacteria bacterium]
VQMFGYTLNMVVLFSLILALGMLVDNAIVIVENIYRHMEMGKPAQEAASIGAREVFWPVIASTATTIAAFLPMYAIGGVMGAFIAVIPAVVTFALLGSLWEAFGVLPSHAAELLKVEHRRESSYDWAHQLKRYANFLRWSLLNRYFVALATIGLLLVMMVIATTRLPFQLFGHVNTGQFFVNIEAPVTYSLEDSVALAARMEQAIMAEIKEEELASLLTNVGVSFVDFNNIKFGSNYIQFIVDLEKQVPQGFIERFITPVVTLKFSWEGTRHRDSGDIINIVRASLQQFPGLERLSILRPQGGPAGADIEIGISGPDVDKLHQLTGEVSAYLKRLPGSHDVRTNLEVGKLEYQYTLNERGRQLGLTQAVLADSVRAGFQGLEALHVTWGDKRIPVRVIYPESLREQSQSLETLRITLASGRSVYLGDVADVTVGRSLSSINRRDLRRLATITAEVDSDVTTPLAVTTQVQEAFADFSEQYPGYELLWLGEKKEAEESISDMFGALVISLAIIFFILAALFKSLLDPVVVMFAIPFGIIGVILGHMLHGHNMQFLSLIGFLALSGIVVNDSLILVDFARRMRAEGMERLEAMVAAGRVRARPILLTSITTFLGISPLIFFATGQTAFLSPMAVSLGYGLLFSTVLILIALPCFYLIADDLREWFYKRLRHARLGTSRN